MQLVSYASRYHYHEIQQTPTNIYYEDKMICFYFFEYFAVYINKVQVQVSVVIDVPGSFLTTAKSYI